MPASKLPHIRTSSFMHSVLFPNKTASSEPNLLRRKNGLHLLEPRKGELHALASIQDAD